MLINYDVTLFRILIADQVKAFGLSQQRVITIIIICLTLTTVSFTPSQSSGGNVKMTVEHFFKCFDQVK